MNDHPNKHIREAIDYALSQEWRLREAAAHAHIWGTLFCFQNDREGCRRTVFCTPRSPQDHAKDICRAVDRCPHGGQ